MRKTRMLKVKEVPYSRLMNEKAKGMVDKFNADKEVLYLEVYESYLNRPLEYILEEGMYSYLSSNLEVVKMLLELTDVASPVQFVNEEIDVDITF